MVGEMSLYDKACDICKIWHYAAFIVGEITLSGLAIYGGYLIVNWARG